MNGVPDGLDRDRDDRTRSGGRVRMTRSVRGDVRVAMARLHPVARLPEHSGHQLQIDSGEATATASAKVGRPHMRGVDSRPTGFWGQGAHLPPKSPAAGTAGAAVRPATGDVPKHLVVARAGSRWAAAHA